MTPCIVYVNGSLLYRNNLPVGAVSASTPAPTNAVGADATSALYQTAIDPGYLVPGTNVLAAEVHLSSPSAPALSFDLELSATRTFLTPWIRSEPQSQSVPAGTDVAFAADVAGTTPLTVRWYFNGSAIAAATNLTLLLPSVRPDQAGAYYFVASNPAGSVTSAVAVLSVTLVDTDGDGMPDYWELAHGLNPGVDDANLDLDEDEMTNLQEYLAGTDPQDAASVLRIDLVPSSRNLSLSFLAISNRNYTVQSRTSIELGDWLPLTNVAAAGTNRSLSLPVIPSDTRRYYRLVTPAL